MNPSKLTNESSHSHGPIEKLGAGIFTALTVLGVAEGNMTHAAALEPQSPSHVVMDATLPEHTLYAKQTELLTLNSEIPVAPHVAIPETYTLRYGDTLWDVIKDRYGYVTNSMVEDTAHQSGLRTDHYFPGNVVIFQPSSGSEGIVRVTDQAESFWNVAELSAPIANTTVEEEVSSLRQANPTVVPEKLKVGDQYVIPNVTQAQMLQEAAWLTHLPKATDIVVPKVSPPQTQNIPPLDLPHQAASEPADPKTLSKELLTNPNITIDAAPHDRVRKSIEAIQINGQTFTHDIGHNGEVPVSVRALQTIVALAANEGIHIDIHSFTTGEHARSSEHYVGRAIDISAAGDTAKVFELLYNNREQLGLDELIWAQPPAGTTNLKGGEPKDGNNGYGPAVLAEHRDHIHVSFKSYDALPDPILTQSPAQVVKPAIPAPRIDRAPSVSQEPIAPLPESIYSDVHYKSGFSVDQINKMLDGTPLAGNGQAIKDVEEYYQIPANLQVAFMQVESRRGQSEIAQRKHNPFGWGAFDSCPFDCAFQFNNFDEAIRQWGGYMYRDYFSEQGKYFNGTTLHGIFKRYSTSHDGEADLIKRVMGEMYTKAMN